MGFVSSLTVRKKRQSRLPGHDRRLHPYTGFRQRDFGSCVRQSSKATWSGRWSLHARSLWWKFHEAKPGFIWFYHINHLGGVRIKRTGVECANINMQFWSNLCICSHIISNIYKQRTDYYSDIEAIFHKPKPRFDKKLSPSRWDDTKWN